MKFKKKGNKNKNTKGKHTQLRDNKTLRRVLRTIGNDSFSEKEETVLSTVTLKKHVLTTNVNNSNGNKKAFSLGYKSNSDQGRRANNELAEDRFLETVVNVGSKDVFLNIDSRKNLSTLTSCGTINYNPNICSEQEGRASFTETSSSVDSGNNSSTQNSERCDSENEKFNDENYVLTSNNISTKKRIRTSRSKTNDGSISCYQTNKLQRLTKLEYIRRNVMRRINNDIMNKRLSSEKGNTNFDVIPIITLSRGYIEKYVSFSNCVIVINPKLKATKLNKHSTYEVTYDNEPYHIGCNINQNLMNQYNVGINVGSIKHKKIALITPKKIF